MDNEIFLSVTSLWEIAIKASLGKLILGKPFDELISEQLLINHIKVLTIEIAALNIVSRLQFYHRDPFDRLFIAQAILEEMPVIGRDPEFDRYPIDMIWQSYPA